MQEPLKVSRKKIYFRPQSSDHEISLSMTANPVHYLYMVLKFVVLFSIVTILYMSEVFFEKVFLTRPWKALFVTTDDSISEWWFRWKIDRYVSPADILHFLTRTFFPLTLLDKNFLSSYTS